MRKPFQLKYESMVWEDDDEKLQAWKDGRTGYPIVDAGMRQINELGASSSGRKSPAHR
jgi:deoxyribodipyrimidine photo-lyase